MNRMNPRYQHGIWLGMRNNRYRVFHRECGQCVQSSRNPETGTSGQMGHRSNQQCDRSTMENDRWTVDSGQTRSSSGPHSNPSVAVRGARVQRRRITKQDINEFGATIGCPGCNAISDNKRAQAHSDRCRMRIEERLRTTPQGAERLERRDEVRNEALAEEVRREEQKRRRSDRTAAEVTETESSAPAASGPRESPIETSEFEGKIDHEISVDDSQWEQTGERKKSNPRR